MSSPKNDSPPSSSTNPPPEAELTPPPLLPDPDNLRRLSRSPHPYRRTGTGTGTECPDPRSRPTDSSGDRRTPPTSTTWPRTSSDSGTEADDESTGLLRGLPAPPIRPRKGLRAGVARGEAYRDAWPPLLRPFASATRESSRSPRRSEEEGDGDAGEVRSRLGRKRRLEVLRRLLETFLLLSVGAVVLWQDNARALAWEWRRELAAHAILVAGLYAAYPLRRNGRLRFNISRLSSFTIPSSFDPAPLLYPVLIPIYVSLSLADHHPSIVLPNILLSLSSLPAPVIPLHNWVHGHSVVQWMVTVAPLAISEPLHFIPPSELELLTLVFPLHQALIPTLDFLLTSSVLPAELQLLTSALINLFLFASSPQAEILKALLWLGSLSLFITCRHVLRWEVVLARIPSWKFRRSPSASQSPKSLLNALDHRICQRLSRSTSSEDIMSDSDDSDRKLKLVSRRTANDMREKTPREPAENMAKDGTGGPHPNNTIHRRRHTISTLDEVIASDRHRTTPSGRRKRSMAPGMATFLSLTVPQAQVRRWLYALYAYAAVVATILGPVRKYVGERALHGAEPFGWAMGYLLGNIPSFRFWTVLWNLEHWIPLPPRLDWDSGLACCTSGWVEHLRQTTFGEANTRLLIMAYCGLVIITGLAVVFQLSAVAEVDTRRKVFHGMMVLMFLPTVFIDPAFCALALALVLSIFLLLDLFRASQLPPVSRPLTYFLAPYVDGRDHRGPVIVSHMFLLIGCSIPLWLSLADLPRTTGEGGEQAHPWQGWNTPSRDLSMVSGIICVGMGDAAASLVGRRIGRLKWFWGGGKSVEGSVAFAAAVTAGLVGAKVWLALGGWAVHGGGSGGSGSVSWGVVLVKAVLAAGGTSATEAILTGCNDNVVVPVVLWLLVRGLGV